MPFNPAASVKAPRHSRQIGKTIVLTTEEARQLLDSIQPTDAVRARDRAVIAGMVYTFGRISALLGMRVKDYYPRGKRWTLRLAEKGGKVLDIPAHHRLEEAFDAYVAAAGIADQKDGPLFRSARGRIRELTGRPLDRSSAFLMIRRRARAAGHPPQSVGCHTLRATGITAYLEAGGKLEHTQRIAGHADPRTTKLYDRSRDPLTPDEIERIAI